MKLFVLGGSGFIGNELVQKASFSNEVLATYNSHNLIKQNFLPIRFSFPGDFEILKKIIITKQPDVIVNFIVNTNLDYCENNKKNAYELNVLFIEKICKLCNEINSKFIHISSDYVFDGKNGNYNENDQTNPVNYYGYTKQLSEEITLKYSKNVVIRTSSVYDLKLKTNFLKFVFEKLNKNEPVFAFNDVFTTPILVDELIESILRVVTSEKSGIFHISGDECVSRFEFAKIIAKKLGFSDELIIPTSVKSIEQKITRPLNSCLNNKKFKEIFNVQFSTLDENLDKLN
jgi:dTDP-4-dehydrorhamnose reductase